MEPIAHFESLKSTFRGKVVFALEAKDFEGVRTLTEVLENLERLQETAAPWLGSVESPDGGRPNLGREGARHDGTLGDQQAPLADQQGALEDHRYPRFVFSDGLLVKQALKRDGINVYEQRISEDQLQGVLKEIRARLPDEAEFHATEVVGRSQERTYHVYMTLGALQKFGYLESPKRGRYRFLRTSEVPWAGEVWEKIEAAYST